MSESRINNSLFKPRGSENDNAVLLALLNRTFMEAVEPKETALNMLDMGFEIECTEP